MKMHIALEIARGTSYIAGDYLLENFRKDASLLSNRSLSKEITTKYDKKSDSLVIEELNRNSDYNILAEESGFINKGNDFTWVVDSLDGTNNFANGEPYFSVSIGLIDKSNPLVGVIYAPFLQEIYISTKGDGAYFGTDKIRVSGTKDIAQGYFVYCEGGDENNKRIAKIVNAFLPDVKDMRKLGSAAIEGARVATGQRDAYITTSISPWDVAAAVLLVQEAGGKVTDFQGNPWKAEKTDLVFSNGKIHDEILERIAEIK